MNGAQASMTMQYELTSSLLIVRRQCILVQLAENISQEEEYKLKEELIQLETSLERMQKQEEKTPKPAARKSKVISLQDPDDLNRAIYKPIVKERLRLYKHAKESIPLLMEQIAELEMLLEPADVSITPSYGEMSGGGDSRFSKVEQAVIQPYDEVRAKKNELFRNRMIMQEMDLALRQLSEYEQMIIHNEYLIPRNERVKDYTLYTKFNWGKTQFYEQKKRAIDELARALKII